jgi:hypothetical protein
LKQLLALVVLDKTYRRHTELVAQHFCPACGSGTFCDIPAYGSVGSWDITTRRISVNARLFDNFFAAGAPQ